MRQKNSEAPVQDNKRVKIALLGEGRIHGEDDAIAMRPYQSSLICNVASSELLSLTRVEFYRTYKQSVNNCWQEALRLAQIKEFAYIQRCRSYLDVNKAILEESNMHIKKSIAAE